MRKFNLMAVVLLMAVLTVLPTAAISSDASITGHDTQNNLSVRTLDVYRAEFTSDGSFVSDQVWAENHGFYQYDAVYFLNGSTNEQAFIGYLEGNVAVMPADDRSAIANGSSVHAYVGLRAPYYWYEDNVDNYDCNPSSLPLKVTTSAGSMEIVAPLTYEHTRLPHYYSPVSCNPTVTAVFDDANYSVHVYYMTLHNGEPNNLDDLNGNIGFAMTQTNLPSFERLYTSLSYEIDGYWEPSSQGSGGMICAVILLVLSLAILAYVVVLRRGPKWAQ